jgi:hypothetical protein
MARPGVKEADQNTPAQSSRPRIVSWLMATCIETAIGTGREVEQGVACGVRW